MGSSFDYNMLFIQFITKYVYAFLGYNGFSGESGM